MKSIYKYTLEVAESNIVKLPLTTNILSVESQGNNIVVYGLIDTEEIETVDYDFRTYGTGLETIDGIKYYTFLGTVKIEDGNLMFHVFYKQIGA